MESRVVLWKRDQTDGGGEKGAQKFGEFPTLVRGMFVQRRQFDLTLGDIVKIIEMVKSIALPRRKKGLQVSSIVSLLILTEDSHLIQGSSWPFLRAVGPKKKKKKKVGFPPCPYLSLWPALTFVHLCYRPLYKFPKKGAPIVAQQIKDPVSSLRESRFDPRPHSVG